MSSLENCSLSQLEVTLLDLPVKDLAECSFKKISARINYDYFQLNFQMTLCDH